LKEREAKREKGEKVLSDSKFQELYVDLAGKELQEFFEKSYVSNDNFTKNFEKYVKKEGENE